VTEGVETLSNHRYVRIELTLNKNNASRTEAKRTGPIPPRWRLEDRDKEALRAAATGTAWSWDACDVSSIRTVDEEANDLQKQMRAVCDAAMPRVSRNNNTRRTVYWWNPEIAPTEGAVQPGSLEICPSSTSQVDEKRRRNLPNVCSL
jgi:hypothetical protein